MEKNLTWIVISWELQLFYVSIIFRLVQMNVNIFDSWLPNSSKRTAKRKKYNSIFFY